MPGGGDDVLAGTTTTDANGYYLFNYTIPGTYYVDIDTATLPGGAAPWTASPGTTDPSSPFNQSVYLDADFGYGASPSTAVIGDLVWSDANNNGVRDPGEPGISGVTLNLIGPGPDGLLGTGDDVVVATTTTNDSGNYYFTGVTPGEYRVDVTDTGGRLAGYTITAGSRDPTPPITVNAGDNYLNADFGYRNTGLYTITERVWLDTNGNGAQDAGEVGIANVSVNLVIAGTDGIFGTADDRVIATTISASNGDFTFTGVRNGDYRIVIGDRHGVLDEYTGTTADATNKYRNVTVAGANITGVHFGYHRRAPSAIPCSATRTTMACRTPASRASAACLLSCGRTPATASSTAQTTRGSESRARGRWHLSFHRAHHQRRWQPLLRERSGQHDARRYQQPI